MFALQNSNNVWQGEGLLILLLKARFFNSSHGLLFLSCYWQCLPSWGEGSPDLCGQSSTGGEKYIPGGGIVLNKKQGIRLTHSKRGLPHRCFVPTLDQRHRQRLAEVKHYQKHSSPAILGRKTRSLPDGCSPRLLRRPGDTCQGSGEEPIHTLQGHRAAEAIFIVVQNFGKCFSNRHLYPFSFSCFLFFLWLCREWKSF